MEPSVKQMLEVAEDCGLKTVEEAYNNYMNHYDAFFLIAKYSEQLHALHSEMKRMCLIEHVTEMRWAIKDITIEEAKTRL